MNIGQLFVILMNLIKLVDLKKENFTMNISPSAIEKWIYTESRKSLESSQTGDSSSIKINPLACTSGEDIDYLNLFEYEIKHLQIYLII
jgi:hypothetical protein